MITKIDMCNYCNTDTKKNLVLTSSSYMGWGHNLVSFKMIPTYMWECNVCGTHTYTDWRTELGYQAAWTKHQIQYVCEIHAKKLIVEHGVVSE